jgi:predicted secreted protein
MVANAGRNLLIDVDDFAGGLEAEIAGQVTGNLTVNREPIDITTKSDLGVQTLLSTIGKFSVEIGFEGVLKDSTIIGIATNDAPTNLGAATVTIGSIGTLTGDFFLSNFTVTGEDGPNAIGFTATLMSSGAVTFV